MGSNEDQVKKQLKLEQSIHVFVIEKLIKNHINPTGMAAVYLNLSIEAVKANMKLLDDDPITARDFLRTFKRNMLETIEGFSEVERLLELKAKALGVTQGKSHLHSYVEKRK